MSEETPLEKKPVKTPSIYCSDDREKSGVTKITPDKANTILTKIGTGSRFQLKGSRVYTAGISAQKLLKSFKEGVRQVQVPNSKETRLEIKVPAILALLISGYHFLANGIKNNSTNIGKLEKIINKQNKVIASLEADIKALKKGK